MSDLTAPRRDASPGPWSYAAVAFAIAAAVVWVFAGIVDDGLYAITGALGVVAFGLGFKARGEAKRVGARQWPALAATIVGGFLGGLVIVFSVAYGVMHLS